MKAHGARAWLAGLEDPSHPHHRSPILTAATTGSHHLSGLARLAAAQGRPLAAILLPQPPHPHAAANARLSLPLLHLSWTLRRWSELPEARRRAEDELESQLRHPPIWLPPGGGGEAWTDGLIGVGEQLARRAAELGADRLVLAAGSGNTTASIWRALGSLGLDLPVLAVAAVPPAVLTADTLADRCRPRRSTADPRPQRALPTIVRERSGAAYGQESPAAQKARIRAEALGLQLDPFYSARALSWVLAEHDAGRLRGRSLLICCNEVGPDQS